MQSLELHKTYPPEEYFRMEEAGELRHEFINGNLVEMSGASRKHHKICKNLLRILENLLIEKKYEVFIENMKVLKYLLKILIIIIKKSACNKRQFGKNITGPG